jgi:hypothetical protein
MRNSGARQKTSVADEPRQHDPCQYGQKQSMIVS